MPALQWIFIVCSLLFFLLPVFFVAVGDAQRKRLYRNYPEDILPFRYQALRWLVVAIVLFIFSAAIHQLHFSPDFYWTFVLFAGWWWLFKSLFFSFSQKDYPWWGGWSYGIADRLFQTIGPLPGLIMRTLVQLFIIYQAIKNLL